jgi:hypothetical protein
VRGRAGWFYTKKIADSAAKGTVGGRSGARKARKIITKSGLHLICGLLFHWIICSKKWVSPTVKSTCDKFVEKSSECN